MSADNYAKSVQTLYTMVLFTMVWINYTSFDVMHSTSLITNYWYMLMN